MNMHVFIDSDEARAYQELVVGRQGSVGDSPSQVAGKNVLAQGPALVHVIQTDAAVLGSPIQTQERGHSCGIPPACMCSVYTEHHRLYSTPRTVHHITCVTYCIVHTVQCILYSAYCTV